MNKLSVRGRWARLVIVALALLGSLPASALGLGDVVIESHLGESLAARIPVVGVDADQLDGLQVRFAGAEERARRGLARPRDFDALRIELVKTGSDAPYVRLSSKGMLREPVLRLLIEAAWAHGRLLREYTLVLDRR